VSFGQVELPDQRHLKLFTNGVKPDAVQHIAGERVNQDVARISQRNTTGPQIEHLVVVELPHRCAVGALHVIGKDLELRLGVDGGVA